MHVCPRIEDYKTPADRAAVALRLCFLDLHPKSLVVWTAPKQHIARPSPGITDSLRFVLTKGPQHGSLLFCGGPGLELVSQRVHQQLEVLYATGVPSQAFHFEHQLHRVAAPECLRSLRNALTPGQPLLLPQLAP